MKHDNNGAETNTKKKTRHRTYNIGLTMIVKNESHVITESLNSIAPYIDFYVISDTGSTDETPAIIRSFFEQKGIPGKIYYDEWSDFGTNRSIVLEHARKHVRYAWMLDADDLVLPPKAKAEDGKQDITDHKVLKADLYGKLDHQFHGYQVGIVEETNENFFYWRTQVFNLSYKWKYEGVLHEYPCLVNRVMSDQKLKRIEGWKVMSRRLGSRNKMDIKKKYEMDAQMLLKALDSDPLNTRNVFYLANSYRDCHQYENAVKWYNIRVSFGGWHEEIFFSLYMIGRMYLFHLKNEKEAVRNCLKAFQVSKGKRAESLHVLVHYYMYENKCFDLALLYLGKIKDLELPSDDGLFIETELYNGSMKQLYEVLLFVNFKYKEICLDNFIDLELKQQISVLSKIPVLFANSPGTVINLPADLVPKNPDPVSSDDKSVNYRVFNPSIACGSGKIMMNVRCTNFDDNYRPCDKDGIIRTVNYITDEDLSVFYRMRDRSEFNRRHQLETKARVVGYEDIRLFYFNGRWCFLANNDEITGYLDKPQMVYGRLAERPDEQTKEWDIEYVVHLQFPFQQQTEKNWVPIVSNDGSTFGIMYSSYPFTVLQPDIVTGFCTIKSEKIWQTDIKHFPRDQKMGIRQSTPYVPFDDGYLGLCHVVYFLNKMNNQRLYYHVFMRYSADFTKIGISDPFHFEEGVIEFTNGLIYDKERDEATISYAVSDRIPKVRKIKGSFIRDMLHDP